MGGTHDLNDSESLEATTIGCVQILARDKVRGGHVDVNGLDIIAADARGEKESPHGYGVYVINAACCNALATPAIAQPS